MNIMQYYPVEFKEVFTSKTLQLSINPSLTVKDFMNEVFPTLSRYFNIQEEELEIVVIGQYRENTIPEASPSLSGSTAKLSDIWGKTLKYLAFYVRRKNYRYPQMEQAVSSVNLL